MATGPPPTDAFVQGLAAPASPLQGQPLDLVEQSSEATKYDDDVMRRQATPQHRLQGGASAVDEEGEEGELAKAGGEEDDEGNEGDADGEDDNMDNDGNVGGDGVEENRFSHCERRRKDHNAQEWHVDDAFDIGDARAKKWQNFPRASMGKACEKAFVKQTLENQYSKGWSNKLRGYMNLATSTDVVWSLVERFFAIFEEGKLPIGDGKIPLDMPGTMEGRLSGLYTDESKGQRILYHCIYARDSPEGSTVSQKDLCPLYFKNFGDMTCREREVALLLLMKGKVVVTNVKVSPPRVSTECLLDIMHKERYMVRLFNYVVFHAEGRADDEWNDDFFMSCKDLEERYGPKRLCATEWDTEREKLHSNKVKMVPRRLGGVEEVRQGAGLGLMETMYKETRSPFHFKVFM
ncbi:hypothetical protein CBR_g40318 [Chara braunii]|uniref:Uncharacterized protein n=1 Tax=Chara braunii TaxID=69332 RepID=A0A388LTK8_CHABU|nr:hypothetical protein CBR_g40318 [Chara braunii]|eukprot:GBG85589.1 hypothetical protein CBR_g40318 [Chara braunii]